MRCSAVSLYTGAGGLDLGFEAAGFETRVAVECDPDAVRTLRYNRDFEVVDRDIHSDAASSSELMRRASLGVAEADILIGGPPCQPFSKSGYWASGDSKRLADPRATTLGAYLRVLRELQPRAYLLENVPGIAFSSKDEGLRLIEREIEAINREIGTNYSFRPQLLRAVEFGVPQDRQRVFIVGHREGREFEFPKPTHRAPDVTPTAANFHGSTPDLAPFMRAWDAIGDLEEDDDPSLQLTGKWADLLPSIPEGENYLYHTDRGRGVPLFGWRCRYWSFLLKLSKAMPSWTIAAQPGPAIGPFHWKSRRLSVREFSRLQTFPEGYAVQGSLRAAQKQIGNAVPSALAELLAREIRRQLLDCPLPNGTPLTLLPRRRADLPPPEAVKPVADKYSKLIGEYASHPGTGKGPGALRRAAAAAAEEELT